MNKKQQHAKHQEKKRVKVKDINKAQDFIESVTIKTKDGTEFRHNTLHGALKDVLTVNKIDLEEK